MELELEENTSPLPGVVWSIDRLVLGDQMLWLGRLCLRLSEICFGCENIFFEEDQLNELFQVLSEGPTVDGLVPFGFVIGAVFLDARSEGLCWIGLRRLTNGWSLMVLKISLIGSLSGVKCTIDL